MKIGVISDTHVQTLNEIPAPIRQALTEVDVIVHAGDFTEKSVLDGLRILGKVKAVCGNMDSGELRGILPEKEQFVFSGKKIGLVHGSGGPWGIAERVRALFADVDIIIFGHSHQACNQYLKGSLFFNPGPTRLSFGLITIEDEIEAEIIKL